MSGITIVADSGTQFKSGSPQYNSICRLDDNNYAIAYQDNSNSNRGTVNVGSRTGTTVTISSGNAVVFNSNTTDNISIVALSSTKIAITFKDDTTFNAYVVICTISGTTITVGTPVSYSTAGNQASNMTAVSALDSSNIVCYAVNSSFNLVAFVASISGTTPSLGSSQSVNSSGNVVATNSIALDSTHTISFETINPNSIKMRSGTVNTGAQTISFGTELNPTGNITVFVQTPLISKFDSQHVLFGYVYNGASGYTDLYLRCCEINLTTNAITAGTAIQNSTSASTDSNYSLCCIGTNNFLISYYTTLGTQCEMRGGTFSGSTTLAFDAQGPVVVDNNTSSYTTLCALTSTDFIIGLKEN